MPVDTVRSDVEILEFLDDFPLVDTCDFGDCTQTATHRIICPCAEGWESICGEHAVVFLVLPELPLYFNGACGHSAFAGECSIVPL